MKTSTKTILALCMGLSLVSCAKSWVRSPEMDHAVRFALLSVSFSHEVIHRTDREGSVLPLPIGNNWAGVGHVWRTSAPSIANATAQALATSLRGEWLPFETVQAHPGYAALSAEPAALGLRFAPAGMKVMGLPDTAKKAALANELGVDAVVWVTHDLTVEERVRDIFVEDFVSAHAVGSDGEVWWNVRVRFQHPLYMHNPGQHGILLGWEYSEPELEAAIQAATNGALAAVLKARE